MLAGFILALSPVVFGAGEGTASLEIADVDAATPGTQVPAGQTLAEGATFVFTVGPSGIAPGGQIVITIPANWSQPQISWPDSNGYVASFSTAVAGMYLTTDTTGQQIIVSINTFSFNPGEIIYINYRQPYTQWATENNVVFRTSVKISSFTGLEEIASSPKVDVVSGPPAYVTFLDWGLTARKGVASGPVRLGLKDMNWITTKSTFPITVSLLGKIQVYNTGYYTYEYVDDPTALFSATADFASPISQIIIPPGSSEVSFYYKTSTGPYSIIQISSTINDSNIQQMWVTVISGGISNSRIHKGDGSSNKSITISPDELAYIDFSLADSNLSWQVTISTSPTRNGAVWTYWGYGLPYSNQVSWNGYFSYYDPLTYTWRNDRAPNGTYYIRIQIGSSGGIVDDSLSVTVQSLEIAGRVIDQTSGQGIAGVYVNAYGPNYAYTISDSSGYYKLAGLRSGIYYLNFWAAGYSPKYLSDIMVPASGVDVYLAHPAYLKVNAQRQLNNINNPELWGGIQVIPSNGSGASNNYWGSLHFTINVSTSDNGQYNYSSSSSSYEIDNSTYQYSAGRWTVLEVAPGTYTYRADLSGYVSAQGSFSIVSGQIQELNLYFAGRKNIGGTIWLPEPSANNWGTWVSIEGIKSGSQWASVWGWAQIPFGVSSGTYFIAGVDPGGYTLRTYAPGYRRQSVYTMVASTDEVKIAPDITLNAGGGFSGTVTVEGDTTDPALSLSDPYNLYLSVWSPETYCYGWTQVSLNKNSSIATATFTISGLDDGNYWVNSWLNGFELENAVGWNGVQAAISNGSGQINLKFKRYSGRIKCQFKVPNSDYNNLYVSIQGNNLWISEVSPLNMSSYGISFDTTTGIMMSPPLGTGFYQIKGRYGPSGLEKSRSVMAINDQTTEISLDLTGQTYTVSGKVSINLNNPPPGYTDLAVLVATAPTYNSTYIWDPVYGSISTTTFRVTAIDYTKMASLSTISGTAQQFSSVINNDGSYRLSGLAPGVYVLQVPALELDGNFDNGKETAAIEKKIVITSGDLSEVNLNVDRGYSVSGQLKLPSTELANREMWVYVFKSANFQMNEWGNYVTGARAIFNNTNTANYEIKGLSPGEYILAVQDWGYSYYNGYNWIYVPRQYANSSIKVVVKSENLFGQNIQLSRGGKITMKLRDADSGTIITPANKDTMLPVSYNISARANPWVEGGWASLSSISGTAQNSGDNFTLEFLPEAVYDVSLGQTSYGYYGLATISGTAGGGNQTNYAAKTISGVTVKNGQTTDLGTIDIKQGLTITGTVKDKNGQAIPNIPVLALPSLSNDFSTELRGFTDSNGKYSIAGLNPEIVYYDIVACPRTDPSYFSGYYFFYGSGGLTYAEKVKSMIKITQTRTVDFILSPARGAVRGKISTEDGGLLANPDDLNIPTAKIFLQLENTFSRTNPLGDIVANTEIDGTFSIEALSPGTYRLTVLSGGYASYSKNITVGESELDIGTIQLKRGARLGGKITKLDNTSPSKQELSQIVAFSEDLSEVLIGSLRLSGDDTVTGYELNGFQAGSVYNIMFISAENELIPAVLGFTVAYSTYTKNDYDLKFKPTAPALFVRAKRNGNTFTINFNLTSPLRNSFPDDNDLTKIISRTSGTGTLSDFYITADRKNLSCIYNCPSGENKFSLKFSAYSRSVNPETGSEFPIEETLEFYSGIAAKNRVRISNLRGGKIGLEDDPSSIVFAPNTFAVGFASAAVDVQLMKGDEVNELTSARSPGKMTIPRSAPAYPENMHRAMSIVKASGFNPLSSFYDIFLPAGVSRALNKEAKLSLKYSPAPGDNPDDYNIYYYDEQNNVWLLQNKNKSVDLDNQTIEISVNHASIFVILKSNLTVISGDTGVSELFVYNFPNPFDLKTKTVNLANAPLNQQQQTITGTMIHYGLPVGVSGDVQIKIYNVAGELVRVLRAENLSANQHYYQEWDGKNDYGKPVASGVYIARFSVSGTNEKFFKMVVKK